MPGSSDSAAGFDLDAAVRKVKDFPKPGILFYDITGILTKPEAFNHCIDRMLELYRDEELSAVAAIEARGFLFAAPFASRRSLPIILLRKKGKLPGKTYKKSFTLEYGEDTIEVHAEDVRPGMRVLIVDDLIATGGTIKAAEELLVSAGAEVAGVFGVIGLPFLNYEIVLEGLSIRTLINYDSE